MKMDIDTGDFQLRIKEYEAKLRDLESEKNKILKERKSYEIEREEEIKALQEALDDTVSEKTRLQNKYNHDFAELQNANSGLMDDFEWKLRQIEQNCKKKIQEKDKQVSECSSFGTCGDMCHVRILLIKNRKFLIFKKRQRNKGEKDLRNVLQNWTKEVLVVPQNSVTMTNCQKIQKHRYSSNDTTHVIYVILW